MSPRPDDPARSLRIVIPAPRRAPDLQRVLEDDRLIDDVRAGLVGADGPRVAWMLALWRRSVLS